MGLSPRAEKAIRKLKEVHKPEIDLRLKMALEREREYIPNDHPLFHDAVDKLIDFNLRGGKRLRPSFIVEAYRCVGGKDMDAIYDASLVIEGSEAWLLIHDDIMDDDTLRRGKPTMHVMYENYLKEKKVDLPQNKLKHMGMALGLNIGDLQAVLTYDWLAKSNFPKELKEKALRRYNLVLRLVCYGQLLDVMAETMPPEKVKEEDVLLIHSLKTSTYTLWGPLQIGAILGGANDEQLEIFYNYGHPLGIAFQLQDDILGLYGDVKKTGKPAHSDLKEGKRTLLIVKALENGTPEQRKRLLEILGNKNLTNEDAEEAREIVRETGALDYNRELAKKLAEEGMAAIENADFDPEGKEYLLGIAEFLINRDV